MGASGAVVIDTFRISNSTKYMGTGPRPLKLTFLTGHMVDIVRQRWNQYKKVLSHEIRICPAQPKQTEKQSSECREAAVKEIQHNSERKLRSAAQSPSSQKTVPVQINGNVPTPIESVWE